MNNKKEPHVLDIKKIRIMLGVNVVNLKVNHFVMEVTKVLNTVPENLLLKKQRPHTYAAVKKPQTVRSATGPITIWNCKQRR